MAEAELSARVQAVKEITSLFRFERYVYLGIIAVCLVILVVSIGFAVKQGGFTALELSTMFGSGGGITVMTGRLLHMWDRSMALLEK